jgi:hypothetical protein
MKSVDIIPFVIDIYFYGMVVVKIHTITFVYFIQFDALNDK